MKQVALVLLSLLLVGAAAAVVAQEQVTPQVPFSTPAPLVRVTPDANDARAAACAAPSAQGYVPYAIRPGDTLAALIAANTSITVTQLAALNCLDDPDALPIGAVIWLPAPPTVESVLNSAAESQTVQSVPPTAETVPEETATSDSLTPEIVPETEAIIQSFNASQDTLLNTDSATLSWLAEGDTAYLYPCFVEACSRPFFAQPLPVEGSVTLGNFHSAGTVRYRLEVSGAGGPVTRDTTVEVTCAQEWLGSMGASPRCPDDPARNVYIVWQPFEHGVMLWFSDTAQIYIMTDDGQLNVYEDVFVEGQPDPSVVAPSGLFTPVRGFGQIWQALGGAESPLGWATTGEIGYDGARQAAGRTSYTTYIQGPGSNVYAITEIPGAENGWWAQVAW